MRHVVREDLLAEARAQGYVDAALSARLKEILAASEPGVVLCTCSTLGAAAEALDGVSGVRVLRIDRPLARAALTQGSRIAIVAALASTLAPTRQLLEEEAERAERDVTLELSLAEGAWQHFEAGDEAAYLRVIAEHVDAVAPHADVIVLAQASMMGAERYVVTEKPVLSSPVLGVKAALELLTP